MDVLIQLIWQVVMIPIGLMFGGMAERKHVRTLDERESINTIVYSNRKTVADPDRVTGCRIVTGSAVIATDYWKSFVTRIKKLVGGELRSVESLMVRARREALARLLEQASYMDAEEVVNIRFETSNIGMMQGGQQGAIAVEVIAWGTAIKRRPLA